jgi:hypothetical protein
MFYKMYWFILKICPAPLKSTSAFCFKFLRFIFT